MSAKSITEEKIRVLRQQLQELAQHSQELSGQDLESIQTLRQDLDVLVHVKRKPTQTLDEELAPIKSARRVGRPGRFAKRGTSPSHFVMNEQELLKFCPEYLKPLPDRQKGALLALEASES